VLRLQAQLLGRFPEYRPDFQIILQLLRTDGGSSWRPPTRERLRPSGPTVSFQRYDPRGTHTGYSVQFYDAEIAAETTRRRAPPTARFRELALGMEEATARAALEGMGLTARAAPSPSGQSWVRRLVASPRGLRCDLPAPSVDPCAVVTLDLASVGQGARHLIALQVGWRALAPDSANAMSREILTPLGPPDRDVWRNNRDERVWEATARRAGSSRIVRWLGPAVTPVLLLDTVIFEDRELARQARLAAASPPRGRR
jgi:hypothetical protein